MTHEIDFGRRGLTSSGKRNNIRDLARCTAANRRHRSGFSIDLFSRQSLSFCPLDQTVFACHSVMGNQNRKATIQEIAHAGELSEWRPRSSCRCSERTAITAAIVRHATTPSRFACKTGTGSFRSNVIWVMPNWLGALTVADVQAMVARANGKRNERAKARRLTKQYHQGVERARTLQFALSSIPPPHERSESMWSPVRTAIFQPRVSEHRERSPGYTSPK